MLKKILGRASHGEIFAGLTFQDLEEITMHFTKREFAQSSYGRFYWVWTKDGQEVSVMLLGADVARLDHDQLRQELGKLSKLDHPNLARLLGYYCRKPRVLCFEYFCNGSLHRHLSDASNGLDWRTRYRIIKGTCEASKYIHVELGEPILHVLMEPRNIFLAKNMEPKLVALGLLQRQCGAYDRKYLAPEYQDTYVSIKKGYIFSLGIVMMEIIAGPMGYSRISDMAHPQFIDQVQENWRKRMQQTCSGSELEFCCQQIKRCIVIALSCVDNDYHKRPKIMEIINKLNETECKIGQTQFGWQNHQTSNLQLYDGNHGGQEMNNVNMILHSKSNSMLMPEESDTENSSKSPIVITDTKPLISVNLLSEEDSSVTPLRISNGRNEHSSSKQKCSLVRMDGMHISQLKVLERTVDRMEPPSNLSLEVLQLITKKFSDELVIGRGGCGVVYKVEQGILTNGIIAVKKLFNSHTVDDKMFHQEVKSMMMVNHQNIVRFLGYCSHTDEKAIKLEETVIIAQIRERLLCFEYIGNGSLEGHLTDELRGLEWHTRYQIIQGICEGLQHLHKEKHIIHMDLKPANILLDDQMVPKITDFGLSRLDGKSQTTSAQRLLSLGYCAPEYLLHGKRSSKSDIYSLGVIIMELVTGSKQIPCTTKVLRKWKHRWNKSTKDIQLRYEQVAKCLNLARRCTQTDPVDRPNIWDIIRDLNKMDNSDVDISDATECLELEDMLGVEPLEIHLPFELSKQMSCSVELTNDTDDYFAFRILTTSLRPYCINTNKDILPPRSKRSVTITLQALEKEPQHNQHRDEFSVQSIRVDRNLTPTDITGELFAEHSGKVVDDVNLVVVLDVPPPLPGNR